jgi:hypothetical protein
MRNLHVHTLILWLENVPNWNLSARFGSRMSHALTLQATRERFLRMTLGGRHEAGIRYQGDDLTLRIVVQQRHRYAAC